LQEPDEAMSIDKSLKIKGSSNSNRSVMKRSERIQAMKDSEKWKDGMSPFGLPKTRVIKMVLKKAKKEKAEEPDDKKKKK
jgi:small basic protein (TIGR04137 family)